jgi:hypothetical protein
MLQPAVSSERQTGEMTQVPSPALPAKQAAVSKGGQKQRNVRDCRGVQGFAILHCIIVRVVADMEWCYFFVTHVWWKCLS